LSAGCDDTNWTICTQLNTNASLAADYPGLFYHSSKFMNSAAIRYFKNVTDFLAGIGLEDAKFGCGDAFYSNAQLASGGCNMTVCQDMLGTNVKHEGKR